MKLFIILFSTLMAGELEVEGGLTVTEGVTASSFVGNGVGLTGIGMKPERIYNQIVQGGDDGPDFNATVPSGKLWIIETFGSDGARFKLNGSPNIHSESFGLLYVIQNTTIELDLDGTIHLSILEYSISGSGTDQGMDYIEP